MTLSAAFEPARRRDGNTALAPRAHELPASTPEVLRSSGRPLAAPLREEMVARLGADFSQVRVHSDITARASAAAIGARAYTLGDHVVIGTDGADKHTLAHELTHVIQQRQGPVAGTDHGNGLKVSDPADRFEQEAETNASRAISGPTSDPATAHAATGPDFSKLRAHADRAAAGAPAPVVQRVKAEDERGKHQRRMTMGNQAVEQLAERVPAKLKDHIFRALPTTGNVNQNAPQGLHGYVGGTLPGGIEVVSTVGNTNKVHTLVWRYTGHTATKTSTMFPTWMGESAVSALVALKYYDGQAVNSLEVNQSENVKKGETAPITTTDIKTHILRGLDIELDKSGDTIYPVLG